MSIDDPRTFCDPANASPQALRLHDTAAESLGAATSELAESLDAEIAWVFGQMLEGSREDALAETFASVPSAAIYRHLWRCLAAQVSLPLASEGVALTLFALPIVLVAGIEGAADAGISIPGILSDAPQLEAILREHGALAGNENFALANALVAADAIEIARLPGLVQTALLYGANAAVPDLPPAPIAIRGGPESVYLRFIVGAAVAAPGVDLLRDGEVGQWGMPFAQALAAQLRTAGATLLPLPRAPANLLVAVTRGRVAQREVGAQVFASNALRKFRASVGEPSAVISAHRAGGPNEAAELRLSLSSPFAERDAEGFRCPLYAFDSVPEVVTMLTDLMRDCRVDDVRVHPGVHADRDATTGAPLLFKPETLPAATPRVH